MTVWACLSVGIRWTAIGGNSGVPTEAGQKGSPGERASAGRERRELFFLGLGLGLALGLGGRLARIAFFEGDVPNVLFGL